MYTMLTSQAEIDAAIAKLTPKGRTVLLLVGAGRCSFFDNGIRPDSGIWGECLAGETGQKPGVLTGLVKQGLMQTWGETDPKGGKWYDLTPLGADVANYLAGNLTTEVAPVEEQVAEIEMATPMTKTEAYAMIKSMRHSLSAADEAVYRGTQAELVALLEHIESNARMMLEVAKSVGVNCGVKVS